ncbi:Uncharacterised protein [Klebsiella michiganensis]|uniref:Uncharacterized protein n=1 Tax=Klebsiella michiganensis TaxID=1134687 RepID=A0A7H4N314_9ENTR|nr:Uncharacterised protein [Klebsiella michiganensis]
MLITTLFRLMFTVIPQLTLSPWPAHLRDAIEGKAYISRWGEQSRNDSTMKYRYSFDVDWITTR